MRRAAAYALDRRALAAVFGEQPSDRLIPPAIGGPGGNIAYPDEPDLATARRLAGPGAVRKATLYFCGDPVNKRIAEIVRANLAEIGIDVRIDQSLGCLTGPETKRLAAADIQLTSRFDVPDPAPFVEMALGNRYIGARILARRPPAATRSSALAGRAEPRASRPMPGSTRSSCATPCPSRSTPAPSTRSSSPRASGARCRKAR